MYLKKISMMLGVLGGMWLTSTAQNTTGHDSLKRTPQYRNKTTTPAVVHDSDLIWAQTLQKLITVNGYQATAAEIARYTDIYNRMQQPGADSSSRRDSAMHNQVAFAPVSQQEIQWALQLESKIKEGYSPTQKEKDQYTDIFNRLQHAQDTSGHWKEWSKPFSTPDREVGPAEIQWALELEQRVKQGYQPTAEETARYEDIAKRLQGSQSPRQDSTKRSSSHVREVTQEEIQWALELEQKVKQGQQPTAEETARYEDIAKRLAKQPVPSGCGQKSAGMTEPLNWALEWLQKTNNGRTGTAAELAMYRWCLKQPGFREQLLAESKKQGLTITLPE
jgi:predicted transcriptional regulator